MEIFKSELFGNVRTIAQEDGEILFVGSDVAKALGYKRERQALAYHVDEEDKLTLQIEASGQKRSVIMINESGMYSLVLKSKMENAKKFKRWVTSEVLPSLRKNGGYIINQELMSENELLKRSIEVAQAVAKQKDTEIQHLLETSMQLKHKDKIAITKEICYNFLRSRGFDERRVPKVHKKIVKIAWGKYENFNKDNPITHLDYKRYLEVMEVFADEIPRQLSIFDILN